MYRCQEVRSVIKLDITLLHLVRLLTSGKSFEKWFLWWCRKEVLCSDLYAYKVYSYEKTFTLLISLFHGSTLFVMHVCCKFWFAVLSELTVLNNCVTDSCGDSTSPGIFRNFRSKVTDKAKNFRHSRRSGSPVREDGEDGKSCVRCFSVKYAFRIGLV